MEHGFFHAARGYWQTTGDVPAEVLAGYPEGTVEVPIKPAAGYEWQDGEWVYVEPPPPPPIVTVVYPVDLWSRMTDNEADQVEAAMATQPARIQNIFRAASSYRSDHELWPLLESISIALFGEERTTEILAPSD